MAVLGNFTDGLVAEIDVDSNTIAANISAEHDFNVPGLELGDVVSVNKPTFQAGLGIVGVRVSALNTLSITYINTTGSSIGTTAENYLLLVIRSETPKRENAIN